MLYIYSQVRNDEMDSQGDAKLTKSVSINRVIIKFYIFMDRDDLFTVHV